MYILYILHVQIRSADRSHYQMLLEQKPNGNFALAFQPSNTTDKYYVIPQWMDDMALLTIHKNPYQVDKFVFQYIPFVPSVGTVAT